MYIGPLLVMINLTAAIIISIIVTNQFHITTKVITFTVLVFKIMQMI